MELFGLGLASSPIVYKLCKVKPRTNTSLHRRQIELVTKFLPLFEAIEPENFARVIESPDSTKEQFVLGHFQYHPAVSEFIEACYSTGLVQSFDWCAWQHQGRRYMNDPNLVGSARLATCIKLITAHLRFERFCDGHIEDVLRSGHMIAILRRLKKLSGSHRTTKACKFVPD